MRSLNLDQLQALVEVVEQGSFSAAARRLHLTQPAVSLQIRELEQRFGVQLVERLGKKAFATAAGHELIAHARRIGEEADQAAATMRRHSDGWLGRVRIAAHESIVSYLLIPVLQRLRETQPKIEIGIMIAATPEAVGLVLANDADLGVAVLPVQDRDLAVTPFYQEPLVAVLPPATASAPTAMAAAELAQHPLILDVPRGQVFRVVRRWFEDGGVTPQPVLELNAHEAIKKLVAGGFGAAILPRKVALDSAGLVIRDLAPPLAMRLGLLQRRNKPDDPALAIVTEALLTLEGG